MNDKATRVMWIEEIFSELLQTQMQGIPILNNAIKVQGVGFQEWEGRLLGIVITPWFMNLLLFPRQEGEWQDLPVGEKIEFDFPSRNYSMMVNEFPGIARCLSYCLYSPMGEFDSHPVAVSVAEAFMEVLLVATEHGQVDDDEVRMARFLEGEEMQTIAEAEILADAAARPPCREVGVVDGEKTLSRRDLLRGAFLVEG